MKIIAVVPALNCENTISRVVKGLYNVVDKVIVIDDGSIDRTRTNGNLNGATVVSHKKNLGLGSALRTGFKEALKRNADIVVTLDGDGQHDPYEVKKVIDLLIKNHCEVVIGSRLLDKSQWNKFPRHRLWGNLVLTFLTNLAIGKKTTTDSQSGYRALKREVFEKMTLGSSRMEIASEIVYEAAKKGFRIKEVSIKATYEDEVSNQRLLKDPLKILLMLFKKFISN